MDEHVQWFDYPGEARGAAGDLTALTYAWLLAAGCTQPEAESLTLAVFQRTRRPMAAWLIRLPTLVRLRVLTTTALRAHRSTPRLTSSDAGCAPAGAEVSVGESGRASA